MTASLSGYHEGAELIPCFHASIYQYYLLSCPATVTSVNLVASSLVWQHPRWSGIEHGIRGIEYSIEYSRPALVIIDRRCCIIIQCNTRQAQPVRTEIAWRGATRLDVIYSILDQIGNTPMVGLQKMTGYGIYAKAEYLNPGGSIKDRVAKYMIEQAEAHGELKRGMTIMEPTSGNTGIGIALIGVQKGYRVVIVMPENMSEERKKIIRALGAELVLTPAADSIAGSIAEVDRQRKADPLVFVPQQFENHDNPRIHYLTTAQEIWRQMDGQVDVFVSGLGSGGTLAGVGRYLKEKNPGIQVIAVEPKNVSALLGHEPGLHRIQGIGDGFIPRVLDVGLIDDVVEVTDDDAMSTARELARCMGLLVGTSAGANVWAAMQIAQTKPPILQDLCRPNIVTILPDRVERYFSTSLI
jgi:cysteine synthase A